MSSTPLKKIGIPRGAYPERREPVDGTVEQFCARLTAPAARRLQIRRLELKAFVQQVSSHSGAAQTFDRGRLLKTADEQRMRLRQYGLKPGGGGSDIRAGS